MASIEDVYTKLGAEAQQRAKFAIDVTIDKIETPSLGLTQALKGGLAFGRNILIWGPKSAGKTTFALVQIAIAQAQGKSCAFFDVEGTFDPEWAARMGVDVENLLYYDDKTVNGLVDNGVKLMSAGIDVIVLDSVSALLPGSFVDKGELKDFADTGAMAALTRDLSQRALPMLGEANKNNTMFIQISQARASSSGMYWGLGPTGGMAVPFYSSTILKLWSTGGNDNTRTGDVFNGDMIVKKPIARKVTWTVEKNKTGPEGETGDYWLYYDGDFIGIDRYEEMLDLGVNKGIITKAGAWYSYGDQQLGQGKRNSADFLREETDLYEQIKEEIYNGPTVEDREPVPA